MDIMFKMRSEGELLFPCLHSFVITLKKRWFQNNTFSSADKKKSFYITTVSKPRDVHGWIKQTKCTTHFLTSDLFRTELTCRALTKKLCESWHEEINVFHCEALQIVFRHKNYSPVYKSFYVAEVFKDNLKWNAYFH